MDECPCLYPPQPVPMPSLPSLPAAFTRTIRAIVNDRRTTPDALFVLADALREAAKEADLYANGGMAHQLRLIAALATEIGQERAR